MFLISLGGLVRVHAYTVLAQFAMGGVLRINPEIAGNILNYSELYSQYLALLSFVIF